MQKIKTYPSGLRIIVSENPHAVLVGSAILIGTGSIDDPKGKEGLAHMVEHAVFLGTKNRTKKQIAYDLESTGSDANAYTDREDTGYHTLSMPEETAQVFSVMADMVINPIFKKEHLIKEKKVVQEELLDYEEDVEMFLYDLVSSHAFKGTKYGHPVQGIKRAVNSTMQEDLFSFVKENYIPQNTVVSFAGAITMQEAERLVEKHMKPFLITPNAHPLIKASAAMKHNFLSKELRRHSDTEQASVLMSFPSFNRFSGKTTEVELIATLLTSGFSGKLFKRVREELGLVYGISSLEDVNNLASQQIIGFQTSRRNVSAARAATIEQLELLAAKPTITEDLELAKKQLIFKKVSETSQLEDAVITQAVEVLNFNKLLTLEEKIARIKSITPKQVQEVAKEMFANAEKKMVFAVVANNAENMKIK